MRLVNVSLIPLIPHEGREGGERYGIQSYQIRPIRLEHARMRSCIQFRKAEAETPHEKSDAAWGFRSHGGGNLLRAGEMLTCLCGVKTPPVSSCRPVLDLLLQNKRDQHGSTPAKSISNHREEQRLPPSKPPPTCNEQPRCGRVCVHCALICIRELGQTA
jgi:hypothetical protein